MAEYQRVQDAIEASNAWELDRQLEIAMDALRLPPPRRGRHEDLRRRAPPRRALQDPARAARTCSSSTSRRTTSTPNRSRGSSGTSREYPGTVVAVTHDRYFLDNVAGWILELDRGAGIPWEGNYSSWLEQKEQRLEIEEKQESAKRRTLQARARMGEDVAARPPGEEQGAPREVRSAARRQGARGARRDRRTSSSRRVRASATSSCAPRASASPTATASSWRTSPSTCRAAASSGSSARTAPARRRSSR